MASDAELVQQVLQEDRQAYALLVRRYEAPVRAATIAILGDTHAAEDAAQEAFLAAYRALGALRHPSSFGPWLMKIARREARRMGKRRKPLASLGEAGHPVCSSTNNRLSGDQRSILHSVGELPDQERSVVMLRYLSNLSVREIAEALSRPIGTVTKQLSRAHERLRAILEEESR